MRVALDLDGVLADFVGAYRSIAERLRPGGGATVLALQPPLAGETPADSRTATRLERRIWREIRATENFWKTLDALEADAVGCVQEATAGDRWDTFFVTQRPATAGDTVQRQTQHWLAAHGFPLPSVIVHRGSRGKLAAALELDFLVDDTIEHCVAAIEESAAKAILICREEDPVTETNAERLGITVCRTVGEALDVMRRESSSPRSYGARVAEWMGVKQR